MLPKGPLSALLCASLILGLVATVCNGKRLRGINKSGSEYSCVQGYGIFDGPVDDASVTAMKSWNVNVVRVPLNEDCWLGINDVKREYSGENYRKAIDDYVQLLRNSGMDVILELHWSGGLYSGPSQGSCYSESALCQKPMPNRQHSVEFWKSVAQKYNSDLGVIFDLFNEAFPDRFISDETDAWKCWRNGGSDCPGLQYEAAGMQDLLDAVRQSGAKNLVMVGGLSYANNLSRWAEFAPKDVENNIAASWHTYNFNACVDKKCWESTVGALHKKVRVIVGEIGQNGCATDYVDPLMDWLEEKGMSYLAWTWNTWDCSSGPSLISDNNGTPTNFGIAIKNRFLMDYTKKPSITDKVRNWFKKTVG